MPLIQVLVEQVAQVPMLVQLSLEPLTLAFMLVVAEALAMVVLLRDLEAQVAVELVEQWELQILVVAEEAVLLVVQESSL